MPKIKVYSGDKYAEIDVNNGTLLSDALLAEGFYVDHPCGGKGKCGKCTVNVDGKELLSCTYPVRNDIVVHLPVTSEIISVTGADQTGAVGKNLVLCLDIGTTTLALALVNCDTKKIISVVTATNPQRAFGADVISRIDHCNKNGITELHSTLAFAVSTLIDRLLNDFSIDKVDKMYVSGNTTMLHTFLGVNCTSLGVAPYTPVFIDEKTVDAKSINLDRVKYITTLQGISAFVGADIVAGLGYVGMPENGRYNLLIDLGTNAEIVLFDQNITYATAAAAGPCFEGANISCGMTATNGAISAYFADGTFDVIGNNEPKGLCATGLIDFVAEMIRNETIDESGFIEDDELQVAFGVTLTQKDIREFQLAKSAVNSAILCLLNKAGISFDDVDKMYVAGGFSASINKNNAAYVGLIPAQLVEKFVAVNNSSLLGTVKKATENTNLNAFTDRAEYVDLSADPNFSDLFFENMAFEN